MSEFSTGGERRRPMRVIERSVYRGPHLFSATPMIRIQLDLGELEDWPSNRIPGFVDRLLEIAPGLKDHGCSRRVAGGLERRLRDGTWMGHVAEHVALELQKLAGSDVTRGKTRSVAGQPGVYNVLYAYREEEVGRLAGRFALQLVDSLLPRELQGVRGLDRVYEDREEPALSGPFAMGKALEALKRLARRRALGPTTASLVAEAERRDIPVLRLDEHSLVQLGWGRRQQRIRASISGRTSLIAVEAAGDKALTKALLADAAIPVPRGAVVRRADDAVREAARIDGPVVVKPLDGNHGRGVSLDLRTEEQVRWGFEQAIAHSRRVLVEEQYEGRDYRILVVEGRVVAVAERRPAQVLGDGVHTVAQLIDIVNQDPRRGVGHEQVMTRIKVDEHVHDQLARAGLSLDSVPEAGRTVQLRATANLSTGGTAVDRTDVIHPENASIAARAAMVIGLDIAGIDFIAPDITRSVRDTGGGIVEVNAAPGFRMHLEPSEGTSRNVAQPVIDSLFGRRGRGRIPVIAITGTNGKSTTVRMVAHMLHQDGLNVGMTTTSGVYIGSERVLQADASGPKSARMVLRDPTVDVAVLETARGGILREGLGFDVCDIGAVLNITSDHLGLKGINTLEDLAKVKSVVVESVSSRGVSVLNADDPHTIAMERHAGGRVAFFSMRGGADMPGFLQRHCAEGGLLVVCEPGSAGDEIVIHDRGATTRLMPVAEIPATLDGLAAFNVQNALAAVAMGYAYGLTPQTMRTALASFASSFEQTPGRLNVHDAHGFRVIVDYAHNPAGLRALRDLVDKLKPSYGRTICMVSIPGDRRDEDILEMGEIAAAGFDELVFREAPDGRGRPDGEVNALLTRGAIEAGFPPERMRRVAREEEAVEACLKAAKSGDLVILTPTSVEKVWAQVLAFRPTRQPEEGRAEQLSAHV